MDPSYRGDPLTFCVDINADICFKPATLIHFNLICNKSDLFAFR